MASLRDAVLVVNRDGEVVLANPGHGATCSQREEADLLRQPAAEVLGGGTFRPGPGGSGGRSAERERSSRSRSATSQYMVSLTPFHSDRGEMLGHIVTISDISEVRRLALEKSRFIRTMIHEFRSPLGAVKGILEVALDKSLGETLEPYLPLLDRAEKRLDGLVELIGNLLSLSRIEAEGKKRTSFEPVEPSALVNEVVELFREKMQSGNLCCEVKVDSSIPRVAVSGEDLKTVLVNLVGNAVKYNREGGKVGVRASRTDGRVRIDVSDTGLGIRAENLPRLFDEFFREKRKETREIEGNGLGLAIVRMLVERSSGKIEVESTEGAGSTFSVYLPVSPAA